MANRAPRRDFGTVEFSQSLRRAVDAWPQPDQKNSGRPTPQCNHRNTVNLFIWIL